MQASDHGAWSTALEMSATIHRTDHGQGVGFGFGDRYAFTRQHRDRHAQLFIGEDLDLRPQAFYA